MMDQMKNVSTIPNFALLASRMMGQEINVFQVVHKVVSMMAAQPNVSRVHKAVLLDFSEMAQPQESIWHAFQQLKTVTVDISAMVS